MRNFILLGIVLFFGLAVTKAQEIQVEKDLIDYGNISKGSDGNKVFIIKNIGDKPLIITNVITSCGCTTPVIPKKPILPGKSDELKVKYDTNRIGPFTKSITILSNSIEKGRVVVSITGKIE